MTGLRRRFLLLAPLAVLLPACGVGDSRGTLTPTVAPAAPTRLSTLSGNDRVTLTWEPSPAAESYTVRRSSSVAGPYTDLPAGTGVTTTTFTDTTVPGGATFYYTIRAVNRYGSSNDSTPIAARSGFVGKLVAAGTQHSLAVLEDGTLWSWGANHSRQLGDGSATLISSVAVPVVGMAGVTAIAAGAKHSLAVLADGTVWAWGENTQGQIGDGSGPATLRNVPVPVPGISDAIDVAAGDGHSLALKSDGTVLAWGKAMGPGGTNVDAPTPVPSVTGVVKISACIDQSFVLLEDGTIWAWGLNDFGQLGIGVTGGSVLVPTKVSNLTQVVDVDAGRWSGLAIRSDGSVWAWGRGSSGELGQGNFNPSDVPVLVPGIQGAVAVQAGNSSSVVLLADGTLLGWGNGGLGVLGGASGLVPTVIPGLSGIRRISVGLSHSLSIGSSGEIWALGDNSMSQLGSGTGANLNTPVPAANLTDVVQVSAASNHSLALRSDGTVWGWGGNVSGCLGPGVVSNNNPFRIQIAGLTGAAVTHVQAGGDPFQSRAWSLALRSDGTVLAWGENGFGILGTGSPSSPNETPAPVSGLTGTTPDTTITALATGRNHSLALAESGVVWSWGMNTEGQLGNNSTNNSGIPVPVQGLTGVTAIAAGQNFSLAVVGSGPSSTVWAWGVNDLGQLGYVGPRSLIPVPVAGISGAAALSAGWRSSYARMADKTIWAWGDNSNGQLGDGSPTPPTSRAAPAPVSGVTEAVSIAAGALHCIAVLSDGTLRAWGLNNSGQLATNSPLVNIHIPETVAGLTGASKATSGFLYNLVLRSDGSVWGWGANGGGTLGIGTMGTSSIPILVTH